MPNRYEGTSAPRSSHRPSQQDFHEGANGIRLGSRPDLAGSWTRFSCYTDIVPRNVTITLDEDVACWARVRAAERDTSVSRLVGEMLRERMQAEQRYDAAMQEYLARPPRRLKQPGARYPKRAELHGR